MSSIYFGRYETIREVGRGGMATVYLAHDPRFKRDVAIKVLPAQFTHDPTFRARFEREAQTIAQLEHPAIVPVYDFGEQNEQPFLVMRYMSGASLAERLRQQSISPKETAQILARIASALDRAHSQGIIHRDLKPANILFDQHGEAYLADFGIAKLVESAATLTGSSVIGTPAYMSPEQVKGQKLDGRSDIYSLAIIVFEMLTGSQPYEAETPMGQAFKHVLDPVPQIREKDPNIPQAVNDTLNRGLAKEAGDRFRTAGELVIAFDGAISTYTGSAASTPNLASLTPAQETEIATELLPPPSGQTTVLDSDSKEWKPPVLLTPVTVDIASSTAKKIPFWVWGIVAMLLIGGLGGSLLLLGNASKAESIASSTETPISTPLPLATISNPMANAPMTSATSTSKPQPTNILSPSTTQPPTATKTPRPTNTPRPLPAATATIDADPSVYDNFNNPSFDGSLNSNQWQYWDDTYPQLFSQQNGLLELIGEEEAALIAQHHTSLLISAPTYYEADIMLNKAQDGAVSIKLHGDLPNNNYWTTQCGIYTSADRETALAFCDYGFKDDGGANYIDFQSVALDSWNTVRIEFNPTEQTVIYFIDGTYLGSIPLPEIKTARFSLIIGNYAASGSTIGYIDEVRYGPIE